VVRPQRVGPPARVVSGLGPVRGEIAQRLGHRVHVARLDEPARRSVAQQLGDAADREGRDGQRRARRLEQRDRLPLVARGQRQGIQLCEVARRPGHRADELDAPFEVGGASYRTPQLCLHRSRAHHDEAQIPGTALQHVETQIGPLDGLESTDERDQAAVGRPAEAAAQILGLRGLESGHRIVDANHAGASEHPRQALCELGGHGREPRTDQPREPERAPDLDTGAVVEPSERLRAVNRHHPLRAPGQPKAAHEHDLLVAMGVNHVPVPVRQNWSNPPAQLEERESILLHQLDGHPGLPEALRQLALVQDESANLHVWPSLEAAHELEGRHLGPAPAITRRDVEDAHQRRRPAP